MKTRFIRAITLGAIFSAAAASAQTPPPTAPAVQKGTVMTAQANGTFDVKVKPLPEDEKVAGVKVGRLSIDKEWKGDMVGTSKGEMMTTGGEVKGSAGYVAVEIMDVTLAGRKGTFTLMHHATMKGDADFKMLIVVVPDSGTGDLKGISGALTIIIEGKNHSYKFDYTLPESK
ncbi:MAG: DUF3224 domain-containing protein [Vicinamibacteria bacterium]